MPTCPRCALLALVLAVAAFASGCDSTNPGSDLEAVQGFYDIEELAFDPVTTGLPTADVLERLSEGSATVEIVGDGNALVRYRFLGSGMSSRLVFATASATGRTVTLTARDESDADKLEAILLPPTLTFLRDEADALRLRATLALEDVDLEAFDPGVYEDQTSNRGTLTVELRRTSDGGR